jgi:hypothetical protein
VYAYGSKLACSLARKEAGGIPNTNMRAQLIKT